MAGSDEGSGGGEIVDFLLYMFVLGPAVEWCLKSRRINKDRPGSMRGIALAALLLAAIAGVKLSFEYYGRDLNHFETLGVRVDATSHDIKKAYKQISLKYHPDKNPDDKSAATKFIRYQAAYEVLKDASKRETYNKFGQAGVDDKSGAYSDGSSQLWSLSMFYIIWLVVGYLLTMGSASEDGRNWAFCGLLTLAVFEYQSKVMTPSTDYLAPIFPHSTVYEKIEILHKLFPPFMHGARMISQVIFTDIALVNRLRVEELHLKLDELYGKVISMGGATVSAVMGTGGMMQGGGVGVPLPVNASAARGDAATAKSNTAALAQLAEDTATRLKKKGALPNVSVPQPQGSGGGAAPSPQAVAFAARVMASGEEPTAEEKAVRLAAELDAELLQKRSQQRLQNVGIFFAAWAAFKYIVDHELL